MTAGIDNRKGAGLLVGIDKLGATVNAIITEYYREVDGNIYDAVRKAGLETKRELIRNSPRKTGEYAAGWQMRTKRSELGTEVWVMQKKKPGLTHLLEKGHGGPVDGKPIPHIAPAFDVGVEVLRDELSQY